MPNAAGPSREPPRCHLNAPSTVGQTGTTAPLHAPACSSSSRLITEPTIVHLQTAAECTALDRSPALGLLIRPCWLLDPVTCHGRCIPFRSPQNHTRGVGLLRISQHYSRFLPSRRTTGDRPTSRSIRYRRQHVRASKVPLICSTTTIRTAPGPPSTRPRPTPTSPSGPTLVISSTS
jgi:hypothetical protein